MTQHPNSEKAAFPAHACATVPIREGLFSKHGGHGSVPSLAMVLYLYLKVRLRGRLHTPSRPFHGRRAEGLLRVSPSRPLAHLGHLDAQFVLAVLVLAKVLVVPLLAFLAQCDRGFLPEFSKHVWHRVPHVAPLRFGLCLLYQARARHQSGSSQ